MPQIRNIDATEVLDSRGNPTIFCSVTLSDGIKASAIVPSGASTGKREALELRDKDERFLGKGVLKAAENINGVIAKSLLGLTPFEQSKVDFILEDLDGTDNFGNIGANAALGVSMAVARAAAKSLKIPLYRYLGGLNAFVMPTPLVNIINGGSHADNSVDFQEYMIVPHGFDDFRSALRASSEVYHHLKKILKDALHITAVGDEGGFAPNLESNQAPIEVILKAIKSAGYKEGEQISVALDVASSEFYDGKLYNLKSEGKVLESGALIEYYENLLRLYPIVSIEDGLSEDDWEGWKEISKKLGDKIQLVGDDLFVTNSKILKQGIEQKIANSILIKPNQIGTISKTLDAINIAKNAGYTCVMSHRSGESEDTFIADFAVGLNTGQIKTGSTARSERIAKYNRLLCIENELKNTKYIGKTLFNATNS